MTTPEEPGKPAWEEAPPAPKPLTGDELPPVRAPFAADVRVLPTGIILLGALFFALGIFSFVWGLLMLGIGSVSWLTGSVFGADQMALFGSNRVPQAIFGIGGGILQIVVAFGLFGLKKWAWLLAFVGIGWSVVQGVVGFSSGAGFFGICCGIVELIIPAWIVFYLLRKDVRAAFGR